MARERFKYHDGGRAAAGFVGEAEDCVTRAIAITLGFGYSETHQLMGAAGLTAAILREYVDGVEWVHKSADEGVAQTTIRRVLKDDLGWTFHTAWAGTRFVLDDLPTGRVMVELPRTSRGKPPHLCAVVDQVVYDTWDSSEGGRAIIRGWWTPPEPWQPSSWYLSKLEGR